MTAPTASESKRPAVAYLRVSTDKQGEDGLGMQAQRDAVHAWADRHGYEIAALFQEVASGALAPDARPAFLAAIARARALARKHRTPAVLIVAKADRATRDNDAFPLGAIERAYRITIQPANEPPRAIGTTADHITQGITSLFGSVERKIIADRTRDALRPIRERLARGEVHTSKAGRTITRLGGPKAGTRELLARAQQVTQAEADARAAAYAKTIQTLRRAGLSLERIAEEMNALEAKTPGAKQHRRNAGRQWYAMSVKRVLDRLARMDQAAAQNGPQGTGQTGDTPGPISTGAP